MGMGEQVKELVNQMLMPLRNRVYTMMSRAVVEMVKDSDGMQLVKLNILAGESRDDIERFQNFGFSSHPPSGSECVAITMGGNRDHLIVVVADDRASRITGLAEGESVQYNKNGDKWHLKNDGTMEGTFSNNLEITLKKLKIANDTAELVDLLVQTLAALKIEPFIVNKATFAVLETKMESFKV